MTLGITWIESEAVVMAAPDWTAQSSIYYYLIMYNEGRERALVTSRKYPG